MKTARELKGFKREMRGPRITHPEHNFRKRLQAAGIEHICQCIIGFYISDFMIPKYCLVVELDGSSHVGREQYDARRDDFIREAGFTILRLTNRESATYDLSRLSEYRSYHARKHRQALSRANTLKGRAIQERHAR